MSNRKQFDSALYAANDAQARAVIQKYIDNHGLYAVNNDDQYGPDIVVFRGLVQNYYIEAEVKHAWNRPDFPYTHIQLPHRKRKFLQAGLPIEFWILSKDLSQALIIPDYVLCDSLLKEVPNKYVASGELFYVVPIDQCIYIRF